MLLYFFYFTDHVHSARKGYVFSHVCLSIRVVPVPRYTGRKDAPVLLVERATWEEQGGLTPGRTSQDQSGKGGLVK